MRDYLLEGGRWAYYAGIVGTVTLGTSECVLGIAALSSGGGSLSINGGASVPIPAGKGISISPSGILMGCVIVFTGTESYFVETVT